MKKYICLYLANPTPKNHFCHIRQAVHANGLSLTDFELQHHWCWNLVCCICYHSILYQKCRLHWPNHATVLLPFSCNNIDVMFHLNFLLELACAFVLHLGWCFLVFVTIYLVFRMVFSDISRDAKSSRYGREISVS